MDPQQVTHVIQNGTFWMPRSSSTTAPQIDFGWNMALWISVFFFFLIIVPAGYFAWRYRRRSPNEVGAPTSHNTPLEITWTVIPIAVVMACFLVGFRGFISASVAPADAFEVSVIAQKWSWTFVYPNGATTSNELFVPAGRPVKMVMSSRDVLHSFWIPEYRVKQDVVPGLYTSVWFEPIDAHETVLECAEYCGADHSGMLAKVHALEEADFEKWYESSAEVELDGAKLFTKFGCNACHSVDGTRIVGPTMKGLFGHDVQFADGTSGVADESYLRESILNPNAKVVAGYPPIMPPFKGTIKDEQIEAIIRFIKDQK